ncbi:hypothetical protein GCM10023321_29430 [Pseudonocardia eucalypti]|uniref:HTH tetR-type domain-containing protein n=1 Tax=Pseudonocardia eucalypti TaxID=648755 RepID=A0ABP9Q1A8_9PSEU
MREDILTGASELLERSGSEDAITLRAVAREVGISANAIYAHFPHREAILEAVVEEAFVDLYTAVSGAGVGVTDPTARLRAHCAGYLAFAEQRPGRYQVLFGRNRSADGIPKADSVRTMIGGKAFGILVEGIEDCAAAGQSASHDPVADATALWVGLHGYATLRLTVPYFPWPADDSMLDTLLTRMARTTGTAGRAAEG